MSADGNKAVVRRLWEEVWNRADLAVADEIFDAAYAAYEKASVPGVRAAFPDSHHAIEDLIAEGDRVVTRFTWSGTHRGAFLGVPPTGRRVEVGGIWIHWRAGGSWKAASGGKSTGWACSGNSVHRRIDRSAVDFGPGPVNGVHSRTTLTKTLE